MAGTMVAIICLVLLAFAPPSAFVSVPSASLFALCW